MSIDLKNRVRRWVNKSLAWAIIPLWRLGGSPIPTPHSVKQRSIRDFARRYGLTTLVETGTYRGDMVDAMKDSFTAIHSIELYEPLFTAAAAQFEIHSHIHIHFGNSADVFVSLLPGLAEPTLFWLDGHFSGEGTAGDTSHVPVMGELTEIGRFTRKHLILIDDAREFNGKNGYPTLEQIRTWASANGYDCIDVADDIIRIFPGPTRSAE